MKDRIQRQEKILDRQLEWVRAADAKIPPLVLLDVAMLASFATAAVTVAPPIRDMDIAMKMMAFTFLAIDVVSLIILVWSIFPHLADSSMSVVYFGGILKRGRKQYKATMESITDEDYLADLIMASSHNAEIAQHKFTKIKAAAFFAFLAIAFWLLTLYLFLQPV